eukprot:CAMPEP_0113487872 /NCGR_PEP_ID=MMETSP0014_2-20120614/25727_1 /TAXON_ID=2857 /ORGANISM="Nitzschia sp." /LENGTH=684 /DNA_ID=CAMNT_0000381571 /DNA_START=138 /DNA_END=2192 /DNA_ORIENTATION=+ /assembly_acc=CAM_ASM_000159
MSTTTSGEEATYQYEQHEEDHTIAVFFLCFMGILALVLLLGRALHHRPKLNSMLSEPAMVLLVGMFFSFIIKVLYVDNATDDENNNENGEDGDGNDEDHNMATRISNTILSFSGNVFFMGLLPPILFNSGYELKRELFFRHIKPIVSFAAFGTTVSGLVTGLLLWGVQQAGWMGAAQPNLLELLTFGALIAATDTVSVLGVLQAKKVDPHLFSLVFGESALNDAVAIVLFRSFSHLVYIGVDDTKTLVEEIVSFLVEFSLLAVGSPAMGIICSFVAALVFKHLDFNGTPVIELSLYILLVYIPFILAELMNLSGIVTIFFTGMFARRYIEPNVSELTRQNAEALFKLVAYLCETCIFLDLGLSIFGFSGSFHWQFIGFAFLAALIGRAASIYPISFLWNLSLQVTTEDPLIPEIRRRQLRRATVDVASNRVSMDVHHGTPPSHSPATQIEVVDTTTATTSPCGVDGIHVDFKAFEAEQQDIDDDDASFSSASTYSSASSGSFSSSNMSKRRRRRTTPEKRLDKVIPVKFMHVLWFAGLRGAVAYACARDFPDLYGNKDEVVAATMVIVLVTIIVMGGFCEKLLGLLNIKMDVNEKRYMKEWRLRRSLKGAFHDFEKQYVFDVVVKDTIDIEMVSPISSYTAPRLEEKTPIATSRARIVHTPSASSDETKTDTESDTGINVPTLT